MVHGSGRLTTSLSIQAVAHVQHRWAAGWRSARHGSPGTIVLPCALSVSISSSTSWPCANPGCRSAHRPGKQRIVDHDRATDDALCWPPRADWAVMQPLFEPDLEASFTHGRGKRAGPFPGKQRQLDVLDHLSAQSVVGLEMKPMRARGRFRTALLGMRETSVPPGNSGRRSGGPGSR